MSDQPERRQPIARRRLLPREGGRRAEDERAAAEAALVDAERALARCAVLLYPSTIAKRLNVHVETVRGWIRRGQIPAKRLPNGYYRVTGATLDKLLADKETTHNPQDTQASTGSA